VNEFQKIIIQREIDKLTTEKVGLDGLLPTMQEKVNILNSETTEIMIRLLEINNLINSLEENLNG
jgi:hypothetical protein